jgi:hypothetical protein
MRVTRKVRVIELMFAHDVATGRRREYPFSEIVRQDYTSAK